MMRTLISALLCVSAVAQSDVASQFVPSANSTVLGQGKVDVGSGNETWTCQTDTAAYNLGLSWKMHNPNAGVGLLKASHCKAVCQQDLLCVAFVFFADGNKNVTVKNPAGLQPGSCWKYSAEPWPKATPLPGFVTCWKPNVTKPDPATAAAATAATATAAAATAATANTLESVTVAPVEAITIAPVAETVAVAPIDVVTLAPLATAAPLGGAAKEITDADQDETQTGQGGSAWMWVLGIGGIAVVGGIIAAVFCGVCGGSDKPKKKRKGSKKRSARDVEAQE